MAKSRTERIAGLEDEIRQKENQRKKLIQEQKAQERKDRTKRLCRRMGLIESMLPNTIPLSEDLFKSFLEKTLTTEHSRHILDGLAEQNAGTPMPSGKPSAAQPAASPATKSSESAQQGGATNGGDGGNSARVTA